MDRPEPGNKYIVGWLTLRPGMEAVFDRMAGPYAAECRAEPECRFFEMTRLPEQPDTVLVCECFASEAGHAVHRERPHARAFWEKLGEVALRGQFENVIAGAIAPDAHDFAARRPVPSDGTRSRGGVPS